jgi:hypothetical protein
MNIFQKCNEKLASMRHGRNEYVIMKMARFLWKMQCPKIKIRNVN